MNATAQQQRVAWPTARARYAPLVRVGAQAPVAVPTAGHQTALQNATLYAGVAGVGALLGYAVHGTGKAAAWGAALATGYEFGWFLHRVHLRCATYAKALRYARAVGKPLVVVGAPDRGCPLETQCGDMVVDIAPSKCLNSVVADITKAGAIPLPNDSAVVYAPYVLDYVNDLDAAERELRRVAGDRLFVLALEPWTATAYFYHGAKRVVPMARFPEPRGA